MKLPAEVWKPVNGYTGLYEVSDKGRIKALPKRIDSGKCHRSWPEHIMQTAEDNKGYLRTVLSKGGKAKTVKVHRVVAEAFLHNPNGYTQVNHLDGNKHNNAASNLEWCDQSENMLHACRTKLKLCNGENNSAAKLSAKEAEWIRTHYQKRHAEFGAVALGKKFGVHRKTIMRIASGKNWKGGDADVKRSKALSASD